MAQVLFVAFFIALIGISFGVRRGFAADRIQIGYADIKGESGSLGLPKEGTLSVAPLAAFLAAKSYAGFSNVYTEVVEVALQNPATIPTGVAGLGNDKDVKLTLGFQGAEGSFKISLPCPKINVEGGFVVRWGENRAFVPPVKADGEVGDDGNTVAAALISAGVLPAGAKFKYGRIIKVA